jgi:glycosyltransferase involved in cell wall biosynthesis
MARLLYLWQAGFPWEVRVEKTCLALHQRGWEVTILARWKPRQRPEEDYRGLRLVRVGDRLPQFCSLPVPLNPLWYAEIQRTVNSWQPDVVLAREILLAETAGRVCRRRHIPVVIDMAEHYPATMRTFRKYQRNAALRFLVFRARVPDRVERRSLDWADGVITVCEEQNDRLHREYDYPRERIAVVQNTPELAGLAAVRRGSARPPRTFAYHGHMTPQRGLDNLIRGFAQASRDEPDIRLLLAGDGENRADLEQLARQCGVAERVLFSGRYRVEDLWRLYSETDVGLVPYPEEESCQHTVPNKLYDYLACGKPVLVSPTRPLRRIVEQTRTGIVLDSQAPEAIARGIRWMRQSDVGAFAEHGLRAAREQHNWARDAEVLTQFLARHCETRARNRGNRFDGPRYPRGEA